LRLKPSAEFEKDGMIWWGVEPYGSPILSSWFNRDLFPAGRVVVETGGHIEERLVAAHHHRCTIPQLALHLDRKVNEEGFKFDLQEHLWALAALSGEHLLQSAVGPFDRLLGADLFLVPSEPAATIGVHNELLTGYRLDNLASAYPVLHAFQQAQPTRNRLLLGLLWDHEEIGSHTPQGADSPFAQQLMTRLVMPWKLTHEQEICLRLKSLCLSVDVAHAFHTGHAKKFDCHHHCLLGGGVVLKTQAGQRYLSDATTQATLNRLAQQHNIPLQWFAPRNNIPSGSTIGPIHGAATGMPTIDLGVPILSMHSIREVASWTDQEIICRLLSAFLLD
jgi:aspartyl aminopeptidase